MPRYEFEVPLSSEIVSGEPISNADRSIILYPESGRLAKATVKTESSDPLTENQIKDLALSKLKRFIKIVAFERDSTIYINEDSTTIIFEDGTQTSAEILTAKIKLHDSMEMELRDAAGNVLKRAKSPPDIYPDALTRSIDDATSFYLQALDAKHPFEQFRNYYLVLENLLKPTLDIPKDLCNKLHNLGITEVGATKVTEGFCRQLYNDNRNAINHARSNYKVPDNQLDLESVQRMLPVIKDLARLCIEKKK